MFSRNALHCDDNLRQDSLRSLGAKRLMEVTSVVEFQELSPDEQLFAEGDDSEVRHGEGNEEVDCGGYVSSCFSGVARLPPKPRMAQITCTYSIPHAVKRGKRVRQKLEVDTLSQGWPPDHPPS